MDYKGKKKNRQSDLYVFLFATSSFVGLFPYVFESRWIIPEECLHFGQVRFLIGSVDYPKKSGIGVSYVVQLNKK